MSGAPWTVLLAWIAGGGGALADGPLVVGDARAGRGEAASGWIAVPDGVDPGTRLPVTVVHGARPGPVLALVAGTHGYEYTAVLALQRLRERLDPGALRGSAILLHMANPPAFYGRRIYYGPDAKNLNRVYPGRSDGTVSERIAHAITTQVIEPATHLVDMHCGDGNESLRPYSYWMVSGNEGVDRATRRMALAYGFDHVVVDRQRPVDPARSVYTATTAIVRGKPAITTESGGLGLTDAPSVEAHVRGVLSLMADLDMTEAPSVRVERPLWIDPGEVVRAPVTGVWHPVVEKMQSVATGTLLGRITDAFGAQPREVRSPLAGEVLYVVATPPVTEGEPLAYVGRVSEGEPTP